MGIDAVSSWSCLSSTVVYTLLLYVTRTLSLWTYLSVNFNLSVSYLCTNISLFLINFVKSPCCYLLSLTERYTKYWLNGLDNMRGDGAQLCALYYDYCDAILLMYLTQTPVIKTGPHRQAPGSLERSDHICLNLNHLKVMNTVIFKWLKTSPTGFCMRGPNHYNCDLWSWQNHSHLKSQYRQRVELR